MTKEDIEEHEESDKLQSRATVVIGSAGALLALFADLITNPNFINAMYFAFVAVLCLLMSILLGITAIYFADKKTVQRKLLTSSLSFFIGGLITTATAIVSTMFNNVFFSTIASIFFGGATVILFLHIINNVKEIKNVNEPHNQMDDSNEASFLELLERP